MLACLSSHSGITPPPPPSSRVEPERIGDPTVRSIFKQAVSGRRSGPVHAVQYRLPPRFFSPKDHSSTPVLQVSLGETVAVKSHEMYHEITKS